MKKSTVLALSFIAGLMSVAASAHSITYQFSGRTFAGGALSDQSLTGTYTYDPSLYTSFFTDGVSVNQGFINGAPIGSAHGSVRLSGGFSTSFGGSDSPLGVDYETILEKGNVGVDSFALYGDSVDAAGRLHGLQLRTQQSSSSPDLIFAGAPSDDLSLTQPVSFLTPGSDNIGYFALISADGSQVSDSYFIITQISAVPEASTLSMLLAGAGLLSLRLGRRTRSYG